jgi:hypothetical protein
MYQGLVLYKPIDPGLVELCLIVIGLASPFVALLLLSCRRNGDAEVLGRVWLPLSNII